jgi:hypothetical protein
MEPFYVFIIRNDVWIVILSGLGLFWFGAELWRAQRYLHRAVFGLELETGRRRRNQALSYVAAFSLIISVVYYVNVRIKPDLPPGLLQPPTPTPNIFATPLSSPTPLGTAAVLPPSPTIPLVPTITLPGSSGVQEPAPVGAGDSAGTAESPVTPSPAGPTVTPFIACTLDLNISEPRNGAFVPGSINFTGTADFEDFAAYRLEANGPETRGEWASLLGRSVDQPSRDGFLGNVNLSQWESGPYLIRLTGVNSRGTEIGYCVIQVTLNN